MIRVAVAGAAGRMGQAVCAAIDAAPDLVLTGRADPALGTSVEAVLGDADVLVVFTTPDAVLPAVNAAVAAGVHAVVGSSGWELSGLAEPNPERPANVFFAPNFAIGAVLMMRFAADAAKHMAKAEIIELHHDGKVDAPSGTAKRTAELMNPADPGSITIHSVRLPGLVAHQEVLLGGDGETLTIRHDSLDRSSFMSGVLLACRRVGALDRSPVVGLEHLLFDE
ncbi:MAG TPA: dihydrodipicolinate reductase C-terminal domain-containing protein [Solirubrobacteraceae bacterium]|nr:dihydrodipicolinate reductase C-terminal domain-containing protein [Solirubrobacteraceae bacterium]